MALEASAPVAASAGERAVAADPGPPMDRRGASAVLGPGWDFLFLGPGATLAVSAAFFGLARLGQDGAAAALATVLSLLVLGPHYAATYRRAYASAELVRGHPLVTLAAPVLLVAGAWAAVRAPSRVGPLYFLAYVVWSGYHYSGQSLGLAMLFPLRQGARLDRREKRLLALPLYLSWLLSLLGLFRAGAPARNPAYDIVRQTFLTAPLPGWVLPAVLVALAASFGGVAMVARGRRRRGTPLPAASLGVIVAQVIWFGWGLASPFFNIVLVPVFHSLQYLALTSWHHMRPQVIDGAARRRRFAAYVGAVLLLGLAINPGLPWLAIALAGATPTSAATLAAVAAAISAVNLHHFLLDGRIWRMRERRVAQSFAG